MQAVQVIGHRGNKADHTENTLQGFESAFTNNNFDGVELDVVVSQDKRLFVSHDMYAKYNQEYRSHHQFDYQKILDATLAADIKQIGRYPLLEQVFELYHTCASSHKVQIEIKSDPSVELPLSIGELVSAVQTLMHNYNLLNVASITSFDYRYIVESKKQNPNIKTGSIMHRCLLPLDSLISLPIDALIFEKNWLTKEDVYKLNILGIESYVWTANSDSDWARLQQFGVTGIITDRPQDLADWLRG